MEKAVKAVLGGLGTLLGGSDDKLQEAQLGLIRDQQAAIRGQQDALSREQAKQDQIVAAREAESAAAAEEERRIRRKGGRAGQLTFVDSGATGVTGGLSTALGGGQR
jgi:hypothetical protein